jgi:hypothetical protein
VNEAAFQSQITDLAGAYGFVLQYHTFDSRHSAEGFPDLWLVREPPRIARLVVAELKVGRNRPTAAQMRWIAALTAAGIEAYIWYPDDFDEIVKILAGPPRPPARPSGAGSLAEGGRDAGTDEATRGGDEARRAQEVRP